MTRPAAVAVVLAVVALIGVAAWFRVPPAAAVLTCLDGGAPRLDERGVAQCGSGAELPPGQAMTAGHKFDCNSATEEELALVPALGRSVAHQLVANRPDGGYADWEAVDAVAGVGPARLIALQDVCELRVRDAGVW